MGAQLQKHEETFYFAIRMANTAFPISWEEALEGSKLAVENAKRLAEDAELLRQNGRLQSAFSVSLSAWEELGKAALLFRYWKQEENISQKEWMKFLTNHRMKRAAYAQNLDILYPKSSPPVSKDDMLQKLREVMTESGKHFDLERDRGLRRLGGKMAISLQTAQRVVFLSLRFGLLDN